VQINDEVKRRMRSTGRQRSKRAEDEEEEYSEGGYTGNPRALS